MIISYHLQCLNISTAGYIGYVSWCDAGKTTKFHGRMCCCAYNRVDTVLLDKSSAMAFTDESIGYSFGMTQLAPRILSNCCRDHRIRASLWMFLRLFVASVHWCCSKSTSSSFPFHHRKQTSYSLDKKCAVGNDGGDDDAFVCRQLYRHHLQDLARSPHRHRHSHNNPTAKW